MPVRPAAARCARRIVRARLPLACVVIVAALSGCVFSPKPGGPGSQLGPLPVNATPKGAIDRLQRTYERLDLVDYTGLLTADFRYTFSAQSDPALASLYSDNWGKDDETESAKHLFEGFTNSTGQRFGPASNITVRFDNDQYYADPAHADSAAWYVYCPVSTVNLTVDAPLPDGSTTTYNISAPHSFFLVRGDAAILDAGQRADSTRWYVRHWDDLSPAPAPGGAQQPDAPMATATWGDVKGSYGK